MARIPRRFAQRQALRHGRDGAPPTVIPSEEEHPRSYEPRVKMKRRNQRRKSPSSNSPEANPDSDSEVERDSGYNSQSDCESSLTFNDNDKAMYYQQKIEEFDAGGVTLSNPCDETKAMMEAELERWEM